MFNLNHFQMGPGIRNMLQGKFDHNDNNGKKHGKCTTKSVTGKSAYQLSFD